MSFIYLDNNATTAVDPLVINACLSELNCGASNPSSVHSQGRHSKGRLIAARDLILSHFNTPHLDIVFTSGATEAINMVLRGLKNSLKGRHVISSDIEHLAVYSTLKALQNEGVEVTFLSADEKGYITKEQVQNAIKPNTSLITLMAANNETGVKTDIYSIAQIAKQLNLTFLVDAVAWIGKEPFKMHEGISAIFLSGHKFHAPKGIGACIYRKNLKFESLILGGHQERGKRGGTENLMGIVAMAKAFELFSQNHTHHMEMLRNYLEESIIDSIKDVVVNGVGPRIANTSNLSFLSLEGEMLLMKLDLNGICVSHGSACSSGALEPSRVLINMGLGRNRASSAIRFSLSRYTTKNDIDQTVDVIKKIYKQEL